MSNPIVTFKMKNGGEFKAELYPEIAPNTVNNFISLVSKGFYDGLTVYRAISGFAIYAGDPNKNGTGTSGTSLPGCPQMCGRSFLYFHHYTSYPAPLQCLRPVFRRKKLPVVDI